MLHHNVDGFRSNGDITHCLYREPRTRRAEQTFIYHFDPQSVAGLENESLCRIQYAGRGSEYHSVPVYNVL